MHWAAVIPDPTRLVAGLGTPRHSTPEPAAAASLNQAGFRDQISANDGEALPNNLNLGLVGGSLKAWSTHLWINQLPLGAEAASPVVNHMPQRRLCSACKP